MTTAAAELTLDDCECTYGYQDRKVRFTDPDTRAYVELVQDDDCRHPFEDQEGVTIAFRERDHYNGFADAIPDDLASSCPRCGGSGDDPERWMILRNGHMVGAGTESAMEFAFDHMLGVTGDRASICEAACLRCDGDGEIRHEDIESFVKADRGARAAVVFDTGNHGEATAVVYVTDDDWTDPQGVAEAWRDEYQSWAEGDCYGILSGSEVREGESCWGFIGYEHAKAEAISFLKDEVEHVREVRERNLVRGEN